MLKRIAKTLTYYRGLSVTCTRQNKFEEYHLKEQHTNSTDQNLKENNCQLVKEVSSSISVNVDSPVTAIPFAEINQTGKDSKPSSDISEFIDSLGPPLPVAFNLAAYVNRSESLQKLVQLGVDLSVIEKKPENAKYILKLEFEKDMKSHIKFLHDIGIEADVLGRFITKNPLIFKESIEDLATRINYFRSKNFSREAIARINSSNPIILSMDTKAIDTRLGFLQKQFSLSGDEVRYLVAKNPKLVTYNSSKFREKLFVMKEELGFKSNEMKQILLKKPKVWLIGRKELRERFHFLHNVMGISHDRILSFPNVLLARSFIVSQRHHYLVHLGRAQYDPKQPMYISLEDLATTNDAVFCEKCAMTSVEKFNEFLKTL